MISTQRTKDSSRVSVNQVVEYCSCVGSTIAVVTQRDEDIVVTQSYRFDKRLERGVTSVNVSDSKVACQIR